MFLTFLLSTSMLLTYRNGVEFFSFFGHTTLHAELAHQGSNLFPPQWNGRVLTTGLPGTSDFWHLENSVKQWHIISIFQNHWLHTQEASVGLTLLLSNFPFFGREVPRKRSHGKKQRKPHGGLRVPLFEWISILNGRLCAQISGERVGHGRVVLGPPLPGAQGIVLRFWRQCSKAPLWLNQKH